MKIIIKNHFLHNEKTFEVAERLPDRVITTGGDTFFPHNFDPVLSPLAQSILQVLASHSRLPYLAAWDICDKLSQGAEFMYSEAWEEAIASLLFWGAIEEIPEVEYRYRVARSSVTEASHE